MKPLICLFLLLAPVIAQKPDPELVKLREEYKKASQEYKASLIKLAGIYEQSVTDSEAKLETAKKLYSEGLTSKTIVDFTEHSIADEKAKLEETRRQIARADEEIANLPTDAQLAQEYKKAMIQRRKSYSTPCRNWRLSAFRKEDRGSITIGYKFVCEK